MRVFWLDWTLLINAILETLIGKYYFITFIPLDAHLRFNLQKTIKTTSVIAESYLLQQPFFK